MFPPKIHMFSRQSKRTSLSFTNVHSLYPMMSHDVTMVDVPEVSFESPHKITIKFSWNFNQSPCLVNWLNFQMLVGKKHRKNSMSKCFCWTKNPHSVVTNPLLLASSRTLRCCSSAVMKSTSKARRLPGEHWQATKRRTTSPQKLELDNSSWAEKVRCKNMYR